MEPRFLLYDLPTASVLLNQAFGNWISQYVHSLICLQLWADVCGLGCQRHISETNDVTGEAQRSPTLCSVLPGGDVALRMQPRSKLLSPEDQRRLSGESRFM